MLAKSEGTEHGTSRQTSRINSHSPPASRNATPVSSESRDNGTGGVEEKDTQETGLESTEANYPTGLKLGLILCSIFLAMFLVSLDRMIITTAIPQITNEFHSVTDIGWYGSAYLMMLCAFQLLFGKLYSFYNVKVVFIASVIVFEIGSAVTGAAPSSNAFIAGRAISGLGGAGILSGVIVILIYSVPLRKRPVYQAMFGAIFGLASIIGPPLGGVLTSNATWRWCFYINIPVGGVAIAVILFFLHISSDDKKLSNRAKLAQLDFYGTSLIVPASVCLILALQWGGLTWPWNDARIIALLVLAGILLISFIMVQSFLPKTATLPPRILKQRSILSGFVAALCIGSSQMIFIYFLPIWFQAIQGVSAVESGIRILPLTLAVVFATIFCGFLIRKTGYYTPVLIFGVCLMATGAGLLNTLQLDSGKAQWIGYQILYGLGQGCSFQVPNLAAQTVLPKKDAPMGITLALFGQVIGGAIFVSVGQNVLDNQLVQRLSGVAGFDPNMIRNSGATSLTDLPESIKPAVLLAYNESLRRVFMVGLILSCIIMLPALTMEWRSMKTKDGANKAIRTSAGKDEEK